MKKYSIILILFTLGCAESPNANIKETTTTVPNGSGNLLGPPAINKLYFEGHEYLYVPDGSATWGTHSGSCNNKIHCRDTVVVHDTILIVQGVNGGRLTVKTNK